MQNPFRYFKTSPEVIRLGVMMYVRFRRGHLDEVFVRISGESRCLWWAVEHEGKVLESFVAKKRGRKAVLRFLRRAMERYGRSEVVVTDRLRSSEQP